MFKYPKGSILLENQFILLSHTFLSIKLNIRMNYSVLEMMRSSNNPLPSPEKDMCCFKSCRLCSNADKHTEADFPLTSTAAVEIGCLGGDHKSSEQVSIFFQILQLSKILPLFLPIPSSSCFPWLWWLKMWLPCTAGKRTKQFERKKKKTRAERAAQPADCCWTTITTQSFFQVLFPSPQVEIRGFKQHLWSSPCFSWKLALRNLD